MILELANDAVHGVRGNRERNADRAAGRREDRRVDAYHIAFGIEGRAAGIAFVHRRVDLDKVVIGAGTDVPAARRYDAGGNGAAEAERIANREHPVADARCLIGHFHIGKRPTIDLYQREIGTRIGADHFSLVRLAVNGGDLDVFGLVDHMVIGHRITIGRNKEAGALPGDETAAVAVRHSFRSVRHAKAPEEVAYSGRQVFEALVRQPISLRAAVHANADGDHRRFHLLDDVGKADWCLQLVRLLWQILRDRGWVAVQRIEAGSDHQCDSAQAGDRGGEQCDAARGKHTRLFRIVWTGNDARGHRKTPSGFGGASAPFRAGRWGYEPYSVLSVGLNFRKVREVNSAIKSMD